MDVKDFQHALKLGLGRTILHLKNHNAAPYRDVILESCLKNTVYDRQLEGDKTIYLTELINLTGEKSYYHYHILNVANWLTSDADSYDAAHLFDMTQRLAMQGSKRAKSVLYEMYAKLITPDNLWWSTRIIQLDESHGLRFVLNEVKNLTLNSSQLFELEGVLGVAKDTIGSDKYAKFINTVRQENEQINTLLTQTEEAKQQFKRRKRLEKDTPYSELRDNLDQYVSFWYWGKHASEEDFKQAAYDLLSEKKPERIKKYLNIFHKRPFPLEPKLLFPLVEHTDRRNRPLPIDALRVLENIQHPAVRAFALELIGRNHFAGTAIRLLRLNFEDDDWQLIEDVTNCNLDDIDYHEMGLGIRDIFKSHKTKKATQSLLNVYENGWCSFCRWYIVEAFHSIVALPDHIREECRYDANLDIRELAQNDFESGSDTSE